MKSKWFLTGILSIVLVFGLVLTGCPTDDSGGGGGKEGGSGDKELFAVWYFDTDENGVVDAGEEIAYEFKSDGKLLIGGKESGEFKVSGNQITMVTGGVAAAVSATFEIKGNSLTLSGEASSGFKLGKYAKKGGGSGTSISVSGTAKVGETLTAALNGFTAPVSWKRADTAAAAGGNGGTAIGSSGTTYTITNEDNGKYIWAYATNADSSEEVYSNVIGPITTNGGSGPSISVSGTAKVGETLTAALNGFTAPVSWKRADTAEAAGGKSGTAIASNQTTYTITNEDNGKYIWAYATDTDSSEEVYSNVIGPISGGLTWTSVTISGFSSSSISGIAYGGGKFVAWNSSTEAYSTDGKTWTQMTSTTFEDLSSINGIAYGGGKFVVVGLSRTRQTEYGTVWYSTDGEAWTKSTDTTFGRDFIKGIAYGSDKFVAWNKSTAAYSTDGVTWTAVTIPGFGSSTINSIVYGGDKFVAGGNSGKAAYSADGITWTAVTIPTFSSESIKSIAYGGGKFVAGGGSSRGYAAYSADGVTWTAVTIPGVSSGSINGIAYGGDKFVAVGNDRYHAAAYSTDGVTWTGMKIAAFFNGDSSQYYDINGIAYGAGKFVAVGEGNSSSGGAAAYSNDQE